MHRRSNALARALAEPGVGEGDAVAVMCRNHRGFVDASLAVAKLGADLLYLNTAFAGPQLVDVLEREKPGVVIHDEEFTGLLDEADVERPGASPGPTATTEGLDTLEALIARGPTDDRPAARAATPDRDPHLRHHRHAKGAPRNEAGIDAAVVAAVADAAASAAGTTHIAAPLFHTWGFAHLALAMLLGSTIVLRAQVRPRGRACSRRRGRTLRLARRHPGDAAADPGAARGDARQLRPVRRQGRRRVGLGAAGRPGHRWMDPFGDNLYNIYGSTEVAYATIATPADLRAAPARPASRRSAPW